jgi:hypothetical protein
VLILVDAMFSSFGPKQATGYAIQGPYNFLAEFCQPVYCGKIMTGLRISASSGQRLLFEVECIV